MDITEDTPWWGLGNDGQKCKVLPKESCRKIHFNFMTVEETEATLNNRPLNYVQDDVYHML